MEFYGQLFDSTDIHLECLAFFHAVSCLLTSFSVCGRDTLAKAGDRTEASLFGACQSGRLKTQGDELINT